MSDVKMKALKVIYTKQTGQVDEGQEFEIEATRGRDLETKGFATMVGEVEEKAEEVHSNKMEAPSDNKAAVTKRSKQ